MKKSPRDPLIFIVIGTLIFIYLLIHSVRAYFFQDQAKDWPQGDAEIISVEISEYEYEAGRWVTDYTPHVLYTYEWEGEEYQSRQISIMSQKTRIYEEVTELFEEYNLVEGQIVPVYISPENPAFSVLITDFTKLNLNYWLLLIILIPLSLIGGLGTLWQRRGEIKHQMFMRKLDRLKKKRITNKVEKKNIDRK
jgi:hypothetical protein